MKNSTKSSKQSKSVAKNSKPKERSESPKTDDEETYEIMYDVELMKPGCVILQAFGTVPRELFYLHFGDSNCWLVHPTPGMKLYRVKKSELPLIAEKTDFKR